MYNVQYYLWFQAATQVLEHIFHGQRGTSVYKVLYKFSRYHKLITIFLLVLKINQCFVESCYPEKC